LFTIVSFVTATSLAFSPESLLKEACRGETCTGCQISPCSLILVVPPVPGMFVLTVIVFVSLLPSRPVRILIGILPVSPG
jgi:hypothetical protein